MVAPPRVNLRGVVTSADARKLSLWAEREITWVLENRWKQLCRTSGGQAPDVDWVGVQREVELGLQRRLRRELQVEPLILCLVQPAPAGTPAYKGRADVEPDSRPAPRARSGRDGGRVTRSERPAERPSEQRQERGPRPQRQLAAVGATPAAPAAAPAAVAVQEREFAGRTRRRRSAATAD
jgi:ribonuclease J